MDRIVIEDVRPRTPAGYPAKAVVQRPVRIGADVFRDGHDVLAVRLRWRPRDDKKWRSATMTEAGNDRWEAEVEPDTLGAHEFVVEAWTDRPATWRRDLSAKHEAGQDVEVELEEGARLLESAVRRLSGDDRKLVKGTLERLRDGSLRTASRVAAALDPGLVEALAGVIDTVDHTKSKPFPLWVDRDRATTGAWYELFPRSYGGLRGAPAPLPPGPSRAFDFAYPPPTHPIGRAPPK